MPRTSRKTSFSGYYHVIMRGIDRQIVFESDSDYRVFLNRLEDYSMIDDIKICAYCLMSNHVHLLINAAKENLSVFIKRIGVSYSAYFNKKYMHSGHLFQDRFKSEIIEDERGLLTVFRYILNNPEQAGICRASEYKWSSFLEYNYVFGLTRCEEIHRLIDNRSLVEFLKEKDDEYVMEFDTKKNDDKWALKVMSRILDGKSPTVIQSFEKEKRNKFIGIFKDEGIREAQIARLTGVSRGVVRGVIKRESVN